MKDRVLLAEYGNHLQAELTANLLEEYGIKCYIWSDDCGGIAPGQSFIRGVKVYVDEKDLDRARNVIPDNVGS